MGRNLTVLLLTATMNASSLPSFRRRPLKLRPLSITDTEPTFRYADYISLSTSQYLCPPLLTNLFEQTLPN
ncbi:hypothetical protein BJX70DRAFT_365054 [Aspergillus crustosus]